MPVVAVCVAALGRGWLCDIPTPAATGALEVTAGPSPGFGALVHPQTRPNHRLPLGHSRRTHLSKATFLQNPLMTQDLEQVQGSEDGRWGFLPVLLGLEWIPSSSSSSSAADEGGWHSDRSGGNEGPPGGS